MNIDELKNLQSEGLEKEDLIASIKSYVKEYNLKCDEFGTRYSVLITNLALLDVQNFLHNSNLKYSKMTDHRFLIDGTGIELITADEGFTIAIKEKELYKTFIVELSKDSQPNGFIHKCINVNGKLVSTIMEDCFDKTLKQLGAMDLEVVIQTLKGAMNDVEMAMGDMINSNDVSYEYEYHEYRNEENTYKTIDEIFINEI
ncbi:hypothetical protein [Paenibacillus luteus]|uniref:hypothetical protein n=1 Tax=Paenibacillus luteus TaxID=2545753 RepID=UPI00114129C8|nr:hypothetical protein [Paenibacillus luteus]